MAAPICADDLAALHDACECGPGCDLCEAEDEADSLPGGQCYEQVCWHDCCIEERATEERDLEDAEPRAVKCPVCHSTTDETSCPTCGWVIDPELPLEDAR